MSTETEIVHPSWARYAIEYSIGTAVGGGPGRGPQVGHRTQPRPGDCRWDAGSRSRTGAIAVVSEWYRTGRERPPRATGCGGVRPAARSCACAGGGSTVGNVTGRVPGPDDERRARRLRPAVTAMSRTATTAEPTSTP